ncbi:MAG: hypothetical protein WBO98_02450 [Candidatus Nitrotoga sp.]
MGSRAKTGRVDAELIACPIAQEHTRLRPLIHPLQPTSASWIA